MTALNEPWPCRICPSEYFDVRSLAAHLIEIHDEWLRGRIVPPIFRSEAEMDEL